MNIFNKIGKLGNSTFNEKVEFPKSGNAIRSDTTSRILNNENNMKNIKIDNEKILEILSSMIVETWRLRMAVIQESRFISDIRSVKRLQNQLTRFNKHYFSNIKKLGIEVIDVTHREYEPGLPVNPINLADFTSSDEHLVIELMMEPIIKVTGTADIIHRGIVVLGRASK